MDSSSFADDFSESAVLALRQAAEAGDTDAKATLGRQLLSQPPFRLVEGLKFLLAAVNEGHGAAAHVAAIYAAHGVGMPQSWPTALDFVTRAAELDYLPAQAELAALAGEWNLAAGLSHGETAAPETWARLRAGVDIAAWLAVPRKSIVSASPRVAVVEGMLSPQICDWLIARARPRLKPATTYDRATAEPVTRDGRSNSDCQIPMVESDLILCFVQARIAAVSEVALGTFEAPSILHYRVGQEFTAHYDFLDPDYAGYAKEIASGGQRALTFLICLNEGYEGGETDFPLLSARYKGHRGNGIFFWNVEPDGRIDKRTLHAGLAVMSGEKWLLSQWVRDRPAVRETAARPGA